MGSSGSTPVTQQTTQTKDPWSAAQPHLQNVMGGAASLIGADIGYQPYTGQTVADLPGQTYSAMNDIQGIANNEPFGSADLSQARNLMSSFMADNGMTPDLRNTAAQFGNTANEFNSVYNNNAGANNPYLQGVINQQMNQANAAMSGAGRYGSGSHSAAIAQAISPTLANDYMQRQQMMLSAAQGAGNVQSQLANLYNTAAQRAGNAAQMVPALDAARYTNAGQLLNVGSLLQNQQQAQLAAALNVYNAQQARPWEQLQRYNALAGQAGSLGGTQVTNAPGAIQPSLLQSSLGGALAGASIGSVVPGVGTGIGAGVGGLLGLLR